MLYLYFPTECWKIQVDPVLSMETEVLPWYTVQDC